MGFLLGLVQIAVQESLVCVVECGLWIFFAVA
jgi:hypothetical protein